MKRAALKWLAAFLVTFLVLEGVARVLEIFWPPLPVDYGLGFDEHSRVFSDIGGGLMETRPEKRSAFVLQQFPARRPATRLRVAALGGSSVNRLDGELRKLARDAAAQLPPFQDSDVVIAGGNSYGTTRLLAVLAEVLTYEPNLVIIYTGHNEFESVEQRELAQLETVWLQKALGSLALGRLVRDLLLSFRVSQLEEQRTGEDDAARSARAWRHQFTAEEVSERMAAYERNLRLMVALCRKKGVPVVLGTVVSNAVKPYLPEPWFAQQAEAREAYARGEWARGYARTREVLAATQGRHQASDVENDAVRRVAADEEVPLFDMVAAAEAREPHGVPGETLFSDHCHLNETGNALWRAVVTPLVVRLLQ